MRAMAMSPPVGKRIAGRREREDAAARTELLEDGQERGIAANCNPAEHFGENGRRHGGGDNTLVLNETPLPIDSVPSANAVEREKIRIGGNKKMFAGPACSETKIDAVEGPDD